MKNSQENNMGSLPIKRRRCQQVGTPVNYWRGSEITFQNLDFNGTKTRRFFISNRWYTLPFYGLQNINQCLLTKIIFIIGSLLVLLLIEAPDIRIWFLSQIPSNVNLQKKDSLPVEQLQQLARLITVKVYSGEAWGSGILIQKKEHVYTVLTSKHLLLIRNSYQIQTPDDHLYSAKLLSTVKLNGNDLGVLEFHSSEAYYKVASLGNLSTFAVNDEVYAAGFSFEAEPANPTGFVFTSGEILLITNQALKGGYQIGYTNRVEKGMSGGPLLNRKGQVIGINGMDKYPIWGNPYIFQDNSVPSAETREQMRRLSWAVSVQTFLQATPLSKGSD